MLRNSSRGYLAGQQGGDGLATAVASNGSRKIGQGIQFSEITSFGNGQQASGGQLAGRAPSEVRGLGLRKKRGLIERV